MKNIQLQVVETVIIIIRVQESVREIVKNALKKFIFQQNIH